MTQRSTSEAAILEYDDTVKLARTTQAAIMLEYADAVKLARLTNMVIMIEAEHNPDMTFFSNAQPSWPQYPPAPDDVNGPLIVATTGMVGA